MRKVLAALALPVLVCSVAAAQAVHYVDLDRTVAIDATRGVDPQVDYASLTLVGPWDDRNYQLTVEDLALLAPNEAEQTDPIPAFFRVALRKAGELRREGTAQYPRSALNAFRQIHTGYLIDGKLYRKARHVGPRYFVMLDEGVAPGVGGENDAPSGEVRITNPTGAAESAIKISPADTSKVIAGSNGPGSGQKMHWSTQPPMQAWGSHT